MLKKSSLELFPSRNGYGTLPILPEHQLPVPSFRLWLNATLISVGWFFMFAGMNPVLLLQSSLNSAGGLGVAAMALQHAAMVFGSLMSAPLVRRLGCKWSVVLGAAVYSTFVAANLSPSWAALMPAAAISGLAASVLWTAQRVYIARVAQLLAARSGTDVDRAQSRAFVVTTVSYKMAGTVGHLVSSAILGATPDGAHSVVSDLVRNVSSSVTCGPYYCNEELPGAAGGRDDVARIRALVAVCLASCVIGVIVFVLVDPLRRLGVRQPAAAAGSTSVLEMLKEIASEVRDPRHLLLIPMAAIVSGGDSFWAADFTKSYVTCALGMQWVGYVSVWNGVAGALACLLLGWFNRRKLRSLPFAIATLLQVAVLIAMFYYTPGGDPWRDYQLMALLASGWFFGSGTRLFVAPALYAVLFTDRLEVAFAVFHLWSFTGSTIMFGISNALCMNIKMYALLALLGASFLGYLGVEYLVRKQRKLRDIDNTLSPPLLVKSIK